MIECTGQQQTLEKNTRMPLILALVKSGALGGGVLWGFKLSLGDNQLDSWIEIVGSSCAFDDGNF